MVDDKPKQTFHVRLHNKKINYHVRPNSFFVGNKPKTFSLLKWIYITSCNVLVFSLVEEAQSYCGLESEKDS